MATKILKTWDDKGFVGISGNGTLTYYIRRQIEGKRYTISLRTDDKQVAEERYREFIRNPEGFHVAGTPKDDALWFKQALIDEYLEFSAGPKDKPRNTSKHVNDQRRYLEWWRDELGGDNCDLKQLELKDLTRRLKEGMSAYRYRVTFIRAFFNRLQALGEITATQNVAASLTYEKTESEHRKAIPEKICLKMKSKFMGEYYSAFVLQLATGWHATTIDRFAQFGTIEGDVIKARHKGKFKHAVRISEEALVEAKKLKLKGSLNYDSYYRIFKAIAEECGVPWAGPGNVRPSVVTTAMEHGHTPEEVRMLTGHTSTSMIDRIYNQAQPRKIFTTT